MRIIRELNDSVIFTNPILTLGTFDGVHIGHQEILTELVKTAKEEGKESVLFTFHPHPRMVLYPESHSVRLIDTIDEKLEKLEKLGLDTVILFPFTIPFSRLTAMEFVRDVLVSQIGVTEMRVGHDHHFGKNREGSYQELLELGELYGFTVKETAVVMSNDTGVSSTKIRKALEMGEMKIVKQYMNSPFVLQGEVIHGNKLGRTIGFPTANIHINQSEKILPAIGVYAVRVFVDGKQLNGVMNIGKKPTVQNSDNITVEVFIFDFNADVYGKVIKLEVYDRLRGEVRFNSLDELKHQLAQDAEMARNCLLQLA